MRHLDVALFGTATAFLIVLILFAPFGQRPKCFKPSSSPVFCKVIR
jgi:hypothetical protein